MSKITLTDLTNLQNENTATAAINNNNTILETAFDNSLSRDGSLPNAMLNELDMNSNRIINLPLSTTGSEPIRRDELEDILAGTEGLVVFGTTDTWGTNSTNIYNKNAGYVGLGTLTPTKKLHVYEPSSSANIFIDTGLASQECKLIFGQSGTAKNYIISGGSSYPSYGGANSLNFVNTNATAPITFFTNGSENMRILPGKIFIGRTTAPLQPYGQVVIGNGAPTGTTANSGSGPEGMTVMCGSNASPTTTDTACLMVNRTELLAGGATNAYSAAIVGETVGLVGDTSQSTGLIGYATQYGSFDTCGVIGYGRQVGPASYAAFGGYFQATADSATAGAISIETGMTNNSGASPTFSQSSGNIFIGLDIAGGGAGVAAGQVGAQVRGSWQVGYAVLDGAVSNSAFRSTGFSVTPTGGINYTTVLNNLCDANYKNPIGYVEDGALDRVSQLNLRTFSMKHDPDGRVHSGVFAQEVELIPGFAYLITERDNGYGQMQKSLSQNDLMAEMLKAIQELKLEIDQLKDKK